MKRFIKFLLAMAAFFASLCAFVCVLERLMKVQCKASAILFCRNI